ncbi:putative hydrolase of the HAD superfamily [Fontibacillus phaseoli]|uniref:Putative hydrolase of the HAD superfamily n=1 Tax=Fontibacillus phaseoli TaxID=1416533 RepID=A0A369BPM6_9BACL|nr:HAD family hydrolase [Fontibacillus phaseoli]RCX23570.1 putative hydrolase of the HAD superfamily [Fontibacillus phaseoli]
MNKPLRQQIIFDLDDTLVHCNIYFDQILEKFADLLAEWLGEYRVTSAEIRNKQIEIDVAGVQKIGFVSSHFPQSLIDTYRYFCRILGRELHIAEEDRLMKLGMSVYDRKVEPYPGMVETLTLLTSQGHELYLYTGGETVIQQRKIEQMKLADYFQDRIYIRQHKNIQALEEILSSRKFDRKNTWMIGNSLRTDIEPALFAGVNAIYIKHPNEWSFNMIELKKETDTAMYTVSSLESVPGIIAESLTLAKAGRSATIH